MAQPIWRDYYIQFGGLAGNAADFTIEHDGNVIYQGRAYPKGQMEFARIKINDICADYLRNTLPAVGDIEFTDNDSAMQTFVVDNDVFIQPIYVAFNNDWSYDDNADPMRVLTAAPIRRTFVKGQYLFVGYNSAPEIIQGQITMKDGSVVPFYEPISADPDFNSHFNEDFFIEQVQKSGYGTLTINLGHFPDAVKVEVDGLTWTLQEGCYRYALHYVNAYGGWDSIWMASGVITDTFTRKTAMHLYDNRQTSARGKVNFANPYTKKWQLHSGYLLGEQGESMHHLLGATDVYLQDITTGELIPVTITDNSCEYKSYRSNGGKLVDYTINCELSQTRRRQ